MLPDGCRVEFLLAVCLLADPCKLVVFETGAFLSILGDFWSTGSDILDLARRTVLGDSVLLVEVVDFLISVFLGDDRVALLLAETGLLVTGLGLHPVLDVTCRVGGELMRLTAGFGGDSLSRESMLWDLRKDGLLREERESLDLLMSNAFFILLSFGNGRSILGGVFLAIGVIEMCLSEELNHSFLDGATNELRTGRGGGGDTVIGVTGREADWLSRYDEGTHPSTPSISTYHHPVAFLVMTLHNTPDVNDRPSPLLDAEKSDMVTYICSFGCSIDSYTGPGVSYSGPVYEGDSGGEVEVGEDRLGLALTGGSRAFIGFLCVSVCVCVCVCVCDSL